jgi:hypothetical protein
MPIRIDALNAQRSAEHKKLFKRQYLPEMVIFTFGQVDAGEFHLPLVLYAVTASRYPLATILGRVEGEKQLSDGKHSNFL